MKYFRRLICKLFGCRSIVVDIEYQYNDYEHLLMSTRITHECERCGEIK